MSSQKSEGRSDAVPSPANRPRRSGAAVPAQNRAKASAAAKAAPAASPEHVQPRRAERRPEMIRQRREERRQAYEKRRRQWLLTRIGLGLFGVLAVAGIGYGIYSYVQDQNDNRVPEGTTNYEYAGGNHSSDPVQYAEVPPVGGPHDGTWQNCGFYDQPVRSENAVHSLEHGAVWITYRPDLPQEQIDVLREKAEQDYILVSPFPDLPAPVVASSWNHQVRLDGAEDERLDQFIRSFKEGPDTPEPGALCSGGVGTPV
jgi:hypothetical protein